MIEIELNREGFGIKDLSGQDSDTYIKYWIFSPNNSWPDEDWEIGARNTSGVKSGYIDIFYHGACPESELDTKIKYMVNRTNTIAKICNITIDWSTVHWSIDYQHSFLFTSPGPPSCVLSHYRAS
ncbi:MAG: hypothetical protein QXD64_08805 [Thermoplasmata archaeon]